MNTQELMELARLRALVESGAARSVRLAARLSLREVAEASGAGSPTTILRWERGERRPHGKAALHYADLLTRLMREGR